ncbi:MAG: rRNA maturation RNase YbeY [Rhodothermales bacterium]
MDAQGEFDPDAFHPDSDDAEGSPGIRIEVQHPSRTLPIKRCHRVLKRVFVAEGVQPKRLTVVLADHDTVLDLNRRYLEHDYYTDVLAFDYGGPDRLEGEIYIDLDTAAERCDEYESAYEQEALRYAVHGLLHLIGYSDKTPEEKTEMHELEDRYLSG